jgi:hypothetical protein
MNRIGDSREVDVGAATVGATDGDNVGDVVGAAACVVVWEFERSGTSEHRVGLLLRFVRTCFSASRPRICWPFGECIVIFVVVVVSGESIRCCVVADAIGSGDSFRFRCCCR